MLEFEWLWMFLLLPLPFIVRRFAKPVESLNRAAILLPFFSDFKKLNSVRGNIFSRSNLFIPALIGWILLIAAAARPQWVGEIRQMPVSGRDLMLALDLSGSMEEKDFVLNGQRVSRLQAAKDVAREFIERRRGDRVGLTVFALHPYSMMPLSFDLQTVQEMLEETFIGLAEETKTAIGDAILLSLKQLKGQEGTKRVLVLLTDGANNAGSVTPQKAAQLAAGEGLKIYTIGVGSDIRQRGFFVRQNYDLDEKTLKMIANKTGGHYFRARNTSELRNIYALLDQLEPVVRDAEFFRTKEALYHYPLLASVLIAAMILLIRVMTGSRQ